MESSQLLLSELEAAKVLSISAKTLSKLRKNGDVAFVPIGRAIRYELQALSDFIGRFRTLAAHQEISHNQCV
jgi:hypothetical protein